MYVYMLALVPPLAEIAVKAYFLPVWEGGYTFTYVVCTILYMHMHLYMYRCMVSFAITIHINIMPCSCFRLVNNATSSIIIHVHQVLSVDDHLGNHLEIVLRSSVLVYMFRNLVIAG